MADEVDDLLRSIMLFGLVLIERMVLGEAIELATGKVPGDLHLMMFELTERVV